MTWSELLFAHWAVPASAIAPLLPAGLEVDTWDGQAWVGVVPFRMERVGPRGLQWLPARGPSPRSFLELNVRTYVRRKGRQGVFFLSLDATSGLAVETARRWFGLPYVHADITARSGPAGVAYGSTRRDPRMGSGGLDLEYRAVGPAFRAEPETFEAYAVERYALFSERAGDLLCGHIHHPPWELHRAHVAIHHNTIARAHGLPLSRQPDHVLVANPIDVIAWPPTLA